MPYDICFRPNLQKINNKPLVMSRRKEWPTDVHSAYKNPQKQNAAMNIKIMNCINMARSERTIRLSFKVTNASLGNIKLAMIARKCSPSSRAHRSIATLNKHRSPTHHDILTVMIDTV